MRLLGLTGDIASGKSSVAALLHREHGAAVLDADLLVHELYTDRSFASELAAVFADFLPSTAALLNGDGGIDRAALGRLVFAEPRALRRLESVVHPAVAALRQSKLNDLAALRPALTVVVLEAVKLIESGQARGCAAVWCVRATPAVQLRRLMEDRGLDEVAARARLANQPPFEAKKALLGTLPLVEIWNNGTLDGTLDSLQTVVNEAWRDWERSGND